MLLVSKVLLWGVRATTIDDICICKPVFIFSAKAGRAKIYNPNVNICGYSASAVIRGSELLTTSLRYQYTEGLKQPYMARIKLYIACSVFESNLLMYIYIDTDGFLL